MFVFFSRVLTVMLFHLSVDIFDTSLDRWLFSFAHFVNRYKLIAFYVIIAIYLRNFMRLTLLIFFFRSQLFIYSCQFSKSRLCNHIRRRRLVSLTALLHFWLQYDLTCKFDFAHDIAAFIIFDRRFCIFVIRSSISSIEFDCVISVFQFDNMSFIIFMSISFHASLLFIDADSYSSIKRVDIKMWSND